MLHYNKKKLVKLSKPLLAYNDLPEQEQHGKHPYSLDLPVFYNLTVNVLGHCALKCSLRIEKNKSRLKKKQKNAYLKITEILNIIKVLDILLMAEIS